MTASQGMITRPWAGVGDPGSRAGRADCDARASEPGQPPGRAAGEDERAGGSVLCERPGDDLARRLVGADHDPGGGDLAVDEPQAGGDGAVGEQALADPMTRGKTHRRY